MPTTNPTNTIKHATDRLHTLATADIGGQIIKTMSVVEVKEDGSIFLTVGLQFAGFPPVVEILPLDAFTRLTAFVDAAIAPPATGPVIDTVAVEVAEEAPEEEAPEEEAPVDELTE